MSDQALLAWIRGKLASAREWAGVVWTLISTSEEEKRRIRAAVQYQDNLSYRPQLPLDQRRRSLRRKASTVAAQPQYRDAFSENYGAPLQNTQSSLLMFKYYSNGGRVSFRSLASWTEYPEHIIGHDEETGREATFRKDRVEEWLSGEESLRDRYGDGGPHH